jgi:vacuolar protein sorting-associated protein 13A/C
VCLLFQPHSTCISLTGDVVLRDLQLKREALDKFDLPVDVLEGYLGELTLSIPWSNLKNKPVKVYINNVYLLAVPRNESSVCILMMDGFLVFWSNLCSLKMTDEQRNRRSQQLKKDKLVNAELLSDPTKHVPTSSADPQEEAKNDTFINQLTTKIVDNLQFSMKNIHIRYEDQGTDQSQPFAAGITLGELSAISTNSEWIPTFISEATNTIHKVWWVTIYS